MNTRLKHLSERSNWVNKKIVALQTQRLLLALIIITIIFWFTQQGDTVAFLCLLISSLLFVYLVKKTNNFKKHLSLLNNWQQFLNRQQLRTNGQFVSPEPHIPLALDDVQKALQTDLDLFGNASLFSLIDECRSSGARRILESWLLQGQSEREQINFRRKTIEILSQFQWWVTKYFFSHPREATADGDKEIEVLLKTPILDAKDKKRNSLMLLLYAVTYLSSYLAFQNVFQFHPFLPFVITFMLGLIIKAGGDSSFSRSLHFHETLSGYMPRLNDLSQLVVKANLTQYPQLKEAKVNRKLKLLSTLISFMSVKGHPLVHFSLVLILPWDEVMSSLTEAWRKGFSSQFMLSLKEVYELEAFMSAANFYHHQTKCWPQFAEDKTLATEDVYHPLINRTEVVANSFYFNSDKKLILLTGSNMSGKSTFLRTLAVNQILALAGLPVFAKSFKTSLTPVRTCLKVTDSLSEGYSTFYYEVRAIAKMITEASAGQSFIYFIDEIFRGTNNLERYIGSEKVIAELLRANNAYGFISTHDLQLTQLADKHPQLANFHFKDDVVDGEMSFSYKIHEGPCPTTNALRIMQKEGIPVKVD